MINSGIEWIGEIPDSWKLSRVKYLFYVSKTKAHVKNPTILKLARSGVQIRDISSNEGQLAESYEDYNPVAPEDLLLNPMDLYSGANCNMSEISGVISPAYVNLRKRTEINSKFFDYFFKCQYWTMAMFAHGKGISFDNRWTINADTILNYEIPLPPYDIQNSIVEAIKMGIAKVDKLVEIQQAQIEKLKEYKQSVITEAVTKGIDPNVPMKDSGVEWIGKVPVQWQMIETKYLFDVCSGATPTTSNSKNWDGDIIWVTPADYKTEDIYVSRGRRNLSQIGLSSCSASLIPTGNLIFSKRAPIGAIAINSVDLCTNQGCLGCIVKKVLVLKYYYYIMSIATKQYELLGSGTTFKEISCKNFCDFALPYPTIYEQRKIADYLDDKCSKIDKLIEIKQAKIEKLQEYKKSLIYEYVTGKKEVV